MEEYIEREKAYEKCGWYNTVNGKSICAARKDELAAIPAADVVTVRHGRWGNYEPYSDGYRCSCCKLVHRTCTTYCPNCGVKMDGGADHEDD